MTFAKKEANHMIHCLSRGRNISIFRKLGSGITALFGLSTARSLNGEGSVYKYFDYPIHRNAKIEKKVTEEEQLPQN